MAAFSTAAAVSSVKSEANIVDTYPARRPGLQTITTTGASKLAAALVIFVHISAINASWVAWRSAYTDCRRLCVVRWTGHLTYRPEVQWALATSGAALSYGSLCTACPTQSCQPVPALPPVPAFRDALLPAQHLFWRMPAAQKKALPANPAQLSPCLEFDLVWSTGML